MTLSCWALFYTVIANCDENSGVGDHLCTQQIWTLHWHAAFAPCMWICERVTGAWVDKEPLKSYDRKSKRSLAKFIQVSCPPNLTCAGGYGGAAGAAFLPETVLRWEHTVSSELWLCWISLTHMQVDKHCSPFCLDLCHWSIMLLHLLVMTICCCNVSF